MNFSKLQTKIYNIFSKTIAIAEKDTLMIFRFKYGVILSFITPLISILIPVIVFGKVFEYTSNFGSWTPANYLLFIFTGYCILLLRRMMQTIPANLKQEKFWKTLPALIIAPFNRYYLLFGAFLSEFIMFLIPFISFLVILLIFFPISIFTLITIILAFIAISIVFAGIGLMLGVFVITNENIWGVLKLVISLVLWVSCITYPFELFPDVIQNIINLNPIYYVIDTIRLLWLEDSLILTLGLHPFHILILISSTIIFPVLGVYIFNFTYKKLGITGY